MSTTASELTRLVTAEQKRRKRRKAIAVFIGHVIARYLVLAPLDGLILMILVGIAHAEWVPALPTIGYWWAVLIGVLFQSLIARAPITSSRKKDASAGVDP